MATGLCVIKANLTTFQAIIPGHFIHCPPHLQQHRDSRQSYCSTITVTPYPCCSPYCIYIYLNIGEGSWGAGSEYIL